MKRFGLGFNQAQVSGTDRYPPFKASSDLLDIVIIDGFILKPAPPESRLVNPDKN
jgi:hypothetical protein